MVEVRTIASRVRLEIEKIEGSRFIATAAVAASAGHAAAFVEGVRAEFEDATHHCWAFRGRDRDTFRYVDDGEPSGSAGKPILNAIDGRSLADVVVIVTRYFGGVKLGTGGLVKAYTEAAQALLEGLPRGIHETTEQVAIHLSYAQYDTVKRLCEAHAAEIEDEAFGAAVTLRARLAVDRIAALAADLAEASAGSVDLRRIER